ncbi:biopolymer transporter ExbD [bacterium]|nr:biopolymer transporter ExbD [bacterium]MBU1063820.1 biopolymer transporter ExbD [bacterium]MBU1634029.1 biopolymer transporter ExbD [bacterium]MBU1874823.1 biopolymer transporter ExbD [bacterium]
MKFKKKSKMKISIPTASMPDIVFMLIFFFMVSSVLRTHDGLNVVLPKAKQIEKLESRVHVTYIWVSKEGMISIDGRLFQAQSIRNIMYEKRTIDPQLIVSLRADELVNMEMVSSIHKELRLADALAVNYSTRAM